MTLFPENPFAQFGFVHTPGSRLAFLRSFGRKIRFHPRSSRGRLPASPPLIKISDIKISKIRGHLTSALADLFGLLCQHLHLGPDVGRMQLEHFLDILGAHELLGEVE